MIASEQVIQQLGMHAQITGDGMGYHLVLADGREIWRGTDAIVATVLEEMWNAAVAASFFNSPMRRCALADRVANLPTINQLKGNG